MSSTPRNNARMHHNLPCNHPPAGSSKKQTKQTIVAQRPSSTNKYQFTTDPPHTPSSNCCISAPLILTHFPRLNNRYPVITPRPPDPAPHPIQRRTKETTEVTRVPRGFVGRNSNFARCNTLMPFPTEVRVSTYSPSKLPRRDWVRDG